MNIDFVNYFDNGGNLNQNSGLNQATAITGIATGGLDMLNTAFSQPQLVNTGNLDNVIDSYNEYRPTYRTNDQVLGDYNNFSYIDNVTKRQMMGNSPLEAVGGTVMQGGKGALMGGLGAAAAGAAGLSTIAPGLGTLIGAGAGLLVGGIASLRKNRKAKRASRRMNRRIDEANQNAIDRMDQGMQNVNANMGLNTLSGFYRDGGKLDNPKSDITNKLLEKYNIL